MEKCLFPIWENDVTDDFAKMFSITRINEKEIIFESFCWVKKLGVSTFIISCMQCIAWRVYFGHAKLSRSLRRKIGKRSVWLASSCHHVSSVNIWSVKQQHDACSIQFYPVHFTVTLFKFNPGFMHLYFSRRLGVGMMDILL